MVVLMAGSMVEPAFGALRDGAVHHEANGLSAAHALVSSGDHGHEDGPPGAAHPHGPRHEHGTGADHCTHQHGVPFASAMTPPPSVGLTTESPLRALRPLLPRIAPVVLFHPPRA